MPRVVSFLVLLAILLVVGSVFFQVMAQFLVPLFLACVLLVIFQPLHRWYLRKLPHHPRIAALLTTVSIVLAVLLPISLLGLNAYFEFQKILIAPREDSSPVAVERLTEFVQELLARYKELTGHDLDPQTLVEGSAERIGTYLGAWVVSGVQAALAIMVGLLIMVIALYYFLADGPGMLRTIMRLTPLEQRYELELLVKFGEISRAVVLATVLAAVAQGVLAGIGYYFVLPSEAPIFLLTAGTMALAIVPFLGSAGVWVPVCLYIAVYGAGRHDSEASRLVADLTQAMGEVAAGVASVVSWPLAHGWAARLAEALGQAGDNSANGGNWPLALGLAVYCTIVVSGVDNVIKPFVLHGQSRLHPLLALLSILGGVMVLGPIGILVGPMLVSFLQALLNMFQKELESWADSNGSVDAKLAQASAAVSHSLDPEGAATAGHPSPTGPAAEPADKPPTKPARKKRR